MDERILQIVLQARDEASAVLKNVGEQADKTGTSIKDGLKNNVAQLGGAFAATTGIIYSSISAYEESERVIAQLQAVLKSTSGVAGVTKDSVINLSTALEQQTGVSDEAMTSAQAMLLTFTNIGKDIFPTAAKATLDMATAMNGGIIPSAEELRNQAIQLGKALQDPDAGLGALHRVGVNVDELKKKFTDSMPIQEKQKLILQELAHEFGGSADAAGKTFGGQINKLKENINDLQETMGKGLLDAIVSMTGGMDKLSAKIREVNVFLQTHKTVLLGIVAALLVVAVTFGALFVAALAVVAGTAGLIIAVIGGVVAAAAFMAVMIATHWQNITQAFDNAKNFIINTLITIGTTISTTINNIIQWFSALPVRVDTFLHDLFLVKIPFAVGFAIGYLLGAIPKMIGDVLSWFSHLPSEGGATFEQMKDVIFSIVGSFIAWLGAQLIALPGEIESWIASIPSVVTKVFDNAKQAAINKMMELFNGVEAIWNKIKGIFDAITSAASKAWDAASKGVQAGVKVGMQFADGGYVPQTGLALVHQGEFVLSNAMLQGRQPIPNLPISTTKNNYNQPINIYANVSNGVDMNELGYRLAFALRNSR